mmetsp:Transcript_32155/g.92469  ORF Transcript_32155/g.92469 Transcript_32155/m.92469 type:complete len:93 (+) Transcript_32155:60-338(+)
MPPLKNNYMLAMPRKAHGERPPHSRLAASCPSHRASARRRQQGKRLKQLHRGCRAAGALAPPLGPRASAGGEALRLPPPSRFSRFLSCTRLR